MVEIIFLNSGACDALRKKSEFVQEMNTYLNSNKVGILARFSPCIVRCVEHEASCIIFSGKPFFPGLFRCVECGRCYSHQQSLTDHRKQHEGATTCQLCGKRFAKVSTLRQHLSMVHKLSKEEIHRLVPTRQRNVYSVDMFGWGEQ